MRYVLIDNKDEVYFISAEESGMIQNQLSVGSSDHYLTIDGMNVAKTSIVKHMTEERYDRYLEERSGKKVGAQKKVEMVKLADGEQVPLAEVMMDQAKPEEEREYVNKNTRGVGKPRWARREAK